MTTILAAQYAPAVSWRQGLWGWAVVCHAEFDGLGREVTDWSGSPIKSVNDSGVMARPAHLRASRWAYTFGWLCQP